MTDGGSLAAEPLFGLPLAELWFALLFFIFGTFLFLDGFDFGVGILFATRDDHEREVLLRSIGPFWDGNEVWLVVFGGALFAAFPTVYAAIFSRYYPLLFAILGALGLRGLAPEMYEQRADTRWKRLWGWPFVVGSAATPFLVGVFVTQWLLGTAELVTVPGIAVGLAIVSLSVVDGAAFLCLKTRSSLRKTASTYGVRAAAAYLTLLLFTLLYVYVTTPTVRSLLRPSYTFGLALITVALTLGYVVSIRARRYYLAFTAVGGLVFTLVSLIAGTMFPYVDPAGGVTVREGIVSTLPLNLMSVGAGLLLPLVFVYFAVLYSVFSGPVEA